MASGKKTALYTHSPQECVDKTYKTRTIQTKYYWYHRHGYILADNRYNKNDDSENNFVKRHSYVRIMEERGSSEYGNNVTRFYNIGFSIE